jgi:DNA-binding GntR family transcriptional regulator
MRSMTSILAGTDVAVTSLQERAAAALREAIIHGRLRPGERLSEVELAQQFSSSRSPIREALVLLSQEGFVERTSTGRVYVRPLDLVEAQQLFTVRATLEGLTARIAAENMTRNDTRRLEQNILAMQAASQRGDVSAAMLLGAEFHRTLIAACANRPLEDCLAGFRARTSRYRYILASRNEFNQHRVKEHQKILSALKAQDPQKAEEAMVNHILVSSRETLDALKAYLSDGTLSS